LSCGELGCFFFLFSLIFLFYSPSFVIWKIWNNFLPK
jgi:hypothetical protein